MAKIFVLILTLVYSVCQAQENYVADSVSWLKSSVPDSFKIAFSNSRIKFNGCKHREFELNFSQAFSQELTLEGGISYAKGQLNWGVNSQKISLQRYSFLPRYHFSRLTSVSAGLVLQSSPQFKTSQGVELVLPKSKIFTLAARFLDVRQDNQIDVQLTSHHWQPTGEFGSLFANGLVDNKIAVSYSALF